MRKEAGDSPRESHLAQQEALSALWQRIAALEENIARLCRQQEAVRATLDCVQRLLEDGLSAARA